MTTDQGLVGIGYDIHVQWCQEKLGLWACRMLNYSLGTTGSLLNLFVQLPIMTGRLIEVQGEDQDHSVWVCRLNQLLLMTGEDTFFHSSFIVVIKIFLLQFKVYLMSNSRKIQFYYVLCTISWCLIFVVNFQIMQQSSCNKQCRP